jgi:hypothetical protein
VVQTGQHWHHLCRLVCTLQPGCAAGLHAGHVVTWSATGVRCTVNGSKEGMLWSHGSCNDSVHTQCTRHPLPRTSLFLAEGVSAAAWQGSDSDLKCADTSCCRAGIQPGTCVIMANYLT